MTSPRTLPADFSFASGDTILTASGGTPLTPVFADAPRESARAVLARLREAQAHTTVRTIVYGLVPFDTHEPALLHLTSATGSAPREPGHRGLAPEQDLAPAAVPRVPDAPDYRKAVANALARIEDGALEKVVLARRMHVPVPRGHASVAGIVERLETANPLADVFQLTSPTGEVWLGASPEIVAEVRDGQLVTHPLAGSRPRRAGEPAPEELTHAEKDRREHALVVEHIRAALRPLTETLDAPGAPSVFATDSMWHLGTRITGRVRPGVSALEAALAIHPTPAVCGTPTAVAAAAIRELEDAPRGFYAGLVGWMDATGDGRWSLVLRSAHLADETLTLHAGAGIVACSDPAAEHAETAAKFRTVLAALEGIR